MYTCMFGSNCLCSPLRLDEVDILSGKMMCACLMCGTPNVNGLFVKPTKIPLKCFLKKKKKKQKIDGKKNRSPNHMFSFKSIMR